ncbi:hypothetical protein [Nocardia puris]|uniref:Lipoprotein n=1 Tax=Nocardia puris TaxID=208602 RepID=A0A366DC02_9NOCA|nr:hypothetical protein [Nocardia puris]RBO87546.1 hypothetical protein DFR74_111253 [Nocardia puris]
MLNPQRTAALAVAAFATLGVTACDPAVDGAAVPTSTPIEAPGLWIAPTTAAPAARTIDPYRSNGTWLVPDEIAPGNYKALPTNGSGYLEVCADITCQIDLDGDDTTGLISNEFLTGPGYVTIPAHAFSVELDGIELVAIP